MTDLTPLTPTEYASYLGVGPDTMWRWLRDTSARESLPVRPFRLPGDPARARWRFPRADVERVHGGAR